MTCDRRVVLALGAALLSIGPAFAQPPDPVEPIRLLEAALTGPGDRPLPADQVRSAVERSFDIPAIADAVLDGQAANTDAEQRGRFRAALTDRIARDLLDRRSAGARARLEVVRFDPIHSGEWLVVTRLVVVGETPRTMSWRVRSAAGRARIVDVQVNGSAMVRLMRNEYAVALRRVDLEGLIARMEARNRRARD